MDNFETTLKRAFAEAPEPVADDGFVVRVSDAVGRREKLARVRTVAEGLGFAAGATAVIYGVAAMAGAFAPDLLATAGLELARVHGAMASSSINLSAGLTQTLLVIGALAGGAVVYRANQQQ